MIEIRAAEPNDADAIWQILEPIIRAGEVFALSRDMSRDDALAFWCAPDNESLCAVENKQVLGAAYLKENPLKRGRQTANAGYAIANSAEGRGIARTLCLYTLERAKELGYETMQFNYVVSSNSRAVRLWQSLGFEVIDVLPMDFQHPILGPVDVFVMSRSLP